MTDRKLFPKSFVTKAEAFLKTQVLAQPRPFNAVCSALFEQKLISPADFLAWLLMTRHNVPERLINADKDATSAYVSIFPLYEEDDYLHVSDTGMFCRVSGKTYYSGQGKLFLEAFDVLACRLIARAGKIIRDELLDYKALVAFSAAHNDFKPEKKAKA